MAIAVAEKLGDKEALNILNKSHPYHVETFYIPKYLRAKFTDIILSEGMAGEITCKVFKRAETQSYIETVSWWECTDNNGTLPPEKVLNIWLQL